MVRVAFLMLVAGLASPLCGDVDHVFVIHQEDVPFRIAHAGRYALGEDLLSPAEEAAITIAASDVSLDLGGYTLTGPGRTGDQDHSAIIAASDQSVDRVTISNGTISGFATHAIALPDSTSLVISRLVVREIGEIGIDVGDEATIRDNRVESLGYDGAGGSDPSSTASTRTSAVIGIRAGLNALVESNTISGLFHAGQGHVEGIRVDRGGYVVENVIKNLSTVASGTGDVTGIACTTTAADIRANTVRSLANHRRVGIAIGIRLGSGSADGNRVEDVSAASLAIGIQGIAAVFLQNNHVENIRTIAGGPDAYGLWAAGTGGRVTDNVVIDVDSGGDGTINREVGIRVNSAFEVTGNTVHLRSVRTRARQACVEVSGIFNVIVENSLRVGDPGGSEGVAVLLHPLTSSNTIGGNELINARVRDHGTGNQVPGSGEGTPAI